MRNTSIVAFLLLIMNFVSFKSHAQDTDKAELYVVKFHADWCGSCKAIGPALEDLSNKMDGKPTLFVELDFTNNTTKHQSKLLASALGIENVVAKNNGTGFILVIDSATKVVKAKLTKELNTKEMGNKISSLL